MPAIIRRKLWQTAVAVMAMHLLLRRPVFPVRERAFGTKAVPDGLCISEQAELRKELGTGNLRRMSGRFGWTRRGFTFVPKLAFTLQSPPLWPLGYANRDIFCRKIPYLVISRP